MLKVEKLKIFLASPSDVAIERRYVVQVIEEINRTIASDKGITLEVIRSEKNTFPGYGQDGQAVLNAQIAKMEEYALFIGIMWNRVGTKTARAESGTIEEFEQALKALKRKGQPQIWFYFRQSAARLNSEEELEQRRKVLAFKKKVQRNALTRDYEKPLNFRDQLREHISLWLNAHVSKTPKSHAATSSRSKKSSTTLANSQPSTPTLGSRKKSNSTSTAKKRSPVSSRSTTRTTRSISSSDAWVMLNDNFFLTESVDTQANQTVIVHISPVNPEQEAALRNLQPEQSYKRSIAYAYQNDAAMMQVESVISKSIKGKTLFILTLSPERRSQGSSIMEMSVNGYSADQIAELRARLLLLNETPSIQSKNDSSLIDSWVKGYDNAVKVEKSIFPDLWTRLKTQPHLFLPHACLAAVYHLKMSRTVEHILELKLGLIKDNVMSVQFRGQRKSFYINQEPAIIQVQGPCPLDG